MVAVASGATGSAATALTASTVLSVDFAEDISVVEVIAISPTADIWWTCDGTTPAAGVGFYIPAGSSAVDSRQPPTGGATSVKLWSTGTPTVRVQRAS